MENQTTTQDIVFYQNNTAVTSSRLVAEKFGKRHDHVIRSIEQILESVAHLQEPKIGGLENETTVSDFNKNNFLKSEYDYTLASGGTKKAPEYIMTKDGFTLLVMGFTGKEALKFKIEYINTFNRLEQSLNNERMKFCMTLTSQLVETIDKAAQIVGSQNKLSSLIGVSCASLSLLRKQGVMPNPKYKQSELMIQRIETICERIANGALGYDRDLTKHLLEITNKRARLAITQELEQRGVL